MSDDRHGGGGAFSRPLPGPRQTAGFALREAAEDLAREIMAKTGTSLTPLPGLIEPAFIKLHTRFFAGCEACAREGYHAARAEMLRELIRRQLGQASDLFAKFQDNEAQYIRGHIVKPMQEQLAIECKEADAAHAAFHTCTLTGLPPGSTESARTDRTITGPPVPPFWRVLFPDATGLVLQNDGQVIVTLNSDLDHPERWRAYHMSSDEIHLTRQAP